MCCLTSEEPSLDPSDCKTIDQLQIAKTGRFCLKVEVRRLKVQPRRLLVSVGIPHNGDALGRKVEPQLVKLNIQERVLDEN